MIINQMDEIVSDKVLKGFLYSCNSEQQSVSCSTSVDKHLSSKLLLNRAFDKLAKVLRLLDDLPLSVKEIRPIAPAFRGTEPFPTIVFDHSTIGLTKESFSTNGIRIPKPSATAIPWFPSYAVSVALEASGKWPQDLGAIQRLKGAFYLKTAESLQTHFKGVPAFASPHCLKVLLDGFVFSVEIWTAEELRIVENLERKAAPSRFRAQLEKKIVYNPKICSFLNNFSVRWPSFGPVCGLAKRWIAAQMLSSYLECEAVELCVAYLFLENQIVSVSDGFLKFLNLFATYDWPRNPLILNLNEELDSFAIDEIKKKFLSLRPTLPGLCICTPDDRCGTKYTRDHPIPVVLDRLKRLASAALKLLETDISQQTCSAVFRPVLNHFDVIIHLRRRCLPRSFHLGLYNNKKDSKRRRELSRATDVTIPVTDFDPALEFLQDLRAAFDHLALFFHDEYGGDVIGVLWRPSALLPATIAASHVNGRKLIKGTGTEEDRLVLNLQAAAEDFEILGRGLVLSVDVKRDGNHVVFKKMRKE